MHTYSIIMIIVVIVLTLVSIFIIYQLFYIEDKMKTTVDPATELKRLQYTEPVRYTEQIEYTKPEPTRDDTWHVENFNAAEHENVYVGIPNELKPYTTHELGLAISLAKAAAYIVLLVKANTTDLTINIFNNMNEAIFNIIFEGDSKSIIVNGQTINAIMYHDKYIVARITIKHNILIINSKIIMDLSIQPIIKTITMQSSANGLKSIFIAEQKVFI